MPENGLLCDLNPFRFKNSMGNYLQWQVFSDSAVLYARQVMDELDNSFVRAYPRFVKGTAFGRYESYMMHQLRKLSGVRGQGGMQSPVFDMDQLREMTGWPCPIRDMGDTWIYCDFDIDDSLVASVFVDSYAHAWQGDINSSISPNKSKSLNINVHLGRPKRDNTDAPGGGWSGGKVIAEVVLFGIRWWVVYKRETNGQGNNFDYLSFLPMSGKATMINLKTLYEWAFNNDIKKLAAAVGLEARAIYSDRDPVGGPHIGSEIWHGEGQVLYKHLRIVDHHGDAGFGKLPEIAANDPKPVQVPIEPKPAPGPRDPLFDDVPGDTVAGDGTGDTLPVIDDTPQPVDGEPVDWGDGAPLPPAGDEPPIVGTGPTDDDRIDSSGAPVQDSGGAAIEINHRRKRATVYVPAHIMTENYEITIAPMWRKKLKG